MNGNTHPINSSAQAGSTGEAREVGAEVGGVRSREDLNWLDLWALNPETRAYLETFRRDAACSQVRTRSEGVGDGPQGIRTPEKLRKLQDALYRKAKAEPGYRFWSLYGELTRHDLLEHAFQQVVSNGGAPGVDGQTIEAITATSESREAWLTQLREELRTQTYRPRPIRRVFIPKRDGGQRPLGIPTVKDRVVQMAALMVLGPIFEADFHPHSYGFRPGRSAQQALDTIVKALSSGRLEVVDVDVSKYFESICHNRLMRLIARRTSDGSVLHLLRQWLDAPIVEETEDGRRKVTPNVRGVPQGGVISPLLSNVYLNALDWAVNDPQERGQPVLVRYADDFVILCAPGQGARLLERLARWLDVRGLKLNEQKSRLVSSREGFDFLGFHVRWQRAQTPGRWYAHVAPSAKSQKSLREQVRAHLNHWTKWRRIPEALEGLNRTLRGWSGYFHFRNSSKVMAKMGWWVRDRLRRWLWRKHKQTKALWRDYPDELLHGRYGLWPLPVRVSWKRT